MYRSHLTIAELLDDPLIAQMNASDNIDAAGWEALELRTAKILSAGAGAKSSERTAPLTVRV